MSKTKHKMQEQINQLLAVLKGFDLPVFEDELGEDEEEKIRNDENGYHFFTFETGDITRNEGNKSVSQEVIVYYYSENRDDLDERTVDILSSLSTIPLMVFEGTQKQRLRRKDTDSYVDRIIFLYNRKIVIGCGTL